MAADKPVAGGVRCPSDSQCGSCTKGLVSLFGNKSVIMVVNEAAMTPSALCELVTVLSAV